MNKVRKLPNGCWEWVGAKKDPSSSVLYGHYRCALFPGETMAHRVSHLLFVGPIPDGLNILHSCDFGLCVNPDHGTPGTQKENIADGIKKGRWNRCGEFNGRAKLTLAQVRELRSRTQVNHTQAARQLGVSPTLIDKIMSGTAWKENNNALLRL